MSSQKVFLDVECYRSYFLICFKAGSRTRFYELYEGNPLDIKAVSDIMKGYLTVGFNSNHYDLPMIAYAAKGVSNHQLKKFSDLLINSEKPKYQILRDHNLIVPEWDHIDIIEPAPAVKVGLKMYGSRIHTKMLQDLPLEPDSIIDLSDHTKIQEYCVNDVVITEELYERIKGRIELREQISKQYDVDVRSKSDAQIAETIFKKLLNVGYHKTNIDTEAIYRYKPPSFIKFKTDTLVSFLSQLRTIDFRCNEKGALVKDPLFDRAIVIKDIPFTVGIGGLHSNEKHIATVPNEDEFLIDVDVSSYYPSIILNNGYYPNLVGSDWLNLYKFFYDERLRAKEKGDKVKSESYKIILNGSFGKFGSPYSCLYSPSLLLHTTITGQLSLLMLIEALLLHDFEVVSANTDGITIKGNNAKRSKLDKILEQWQKVSKFILDVTGYKAVYHESVNSYIAITTDNKVKCKGAYATDGLTKNPTAQVCVDAVIEYLLTGMDIEEYIIRNQKHIPKYLIARRVTGGATYKDEYLGKVVRWYYGIAGDAIRYKKNDNKVALSEGAVPLMTLPDKPIVDIDVDKYIEKAFKMLKNLGVKV